MGSESTNATARTIRGTGMVNQTSSSNTNGVISSTTNSKIHTTPNVTKNPKFNLNLAFSNNSKGANYFSSFDQGQDSFRTTR